jgi:hypothetical protein
MAVWLLEYRLSKRRGRIASDAATSLHFRGNDWLQATMIPPARNSKVPVTGLQSDARCVGSAWLGYYLIRVTEGQDGERLAREVGDRLGEECVRGGWTWQFEVRPPSEAELRPLIERYPRAE